MGREALTAHQMAKRISDRDDNIFDKRVIANILDMYMDECRKALLLRLKEPLENQAALVYNLLRRNRN